MSLLDNYKNIVKTAPVAGSVASTSPYTALTLQSKLEGGALVSIVGGVVSAVAAAAAVDGVIIASYDDAQNGAPSVDRNVAIMDSGDIWIPFTGAVVAGDKVEAASGVAVKKAAAGKVVGIATKVIASSACVRLV